MRWKEVETSPFETILVPDLALMVRERLMKGYGLKSDFDPTAIGKVLVRQLEEGPSPSGGLRLSNCGQCIRQLAYNYHHYKPNGFVGDASSPIAFAIGDIVELVIVAALHEAIVGTDIKIESTDVNQETVFLNIPLDDGREARISGHPDGVMTVPVKRVSSDGTETTTYARAILEVKSMSDYAFKKFRIGGLGKDDLYNYQTQAYQLAKQQMTGENFNLSYVIAFGKNVTAKDAVLRDDGSWYKTWPIVGHWVQCDMDIKREIVEKYEAIINSQSPEEFDRPFGPSTAKKTLGQLRFPCDWCAHWRTCWPSAQEKAVSSGFFQKYTKMKVFVGE
jgi:hypothetical protein